MQTSRDSRSPSQEATASLGPALEPEAGDVAYHWDIVTDRISWGRNLAAVTGIADCDRFATGLGYAEHLAPESPSSRYEAIMAPGGCDTGGGVPFTVVYGLLPARRSAAAPVWIEDQGRWFADANDRPAHAQGVIRVVTERVEAERLHAASQRDTLTSAFTRAHFIEHLARQLSLSARRTSTFAVFLFGIEQESAPGLVDDVAIAAAVGRLREQMRAHEVVARHTANKFAILLEACNPEQAEAAAARLIATTAETPPGMPPLLARVGAVIAPTHGRTPQALLQFAEEALEAARQPGSPAYVRYDPDAARAIAKAAPSDELLAALNEGRIALALQPVVDAKTRAVVFYEGLARIRRHDGTIMLPDALVAEAEKSGLVVLLDRRMLELAFFELTSDRKLVVSINASVASLHESCWLDHLRAACKLRPDAARRLTIEITETCAIADVDTTRKVLEMIRPLGVKIAVDDFGSGHSSFRNLRQLPIDFLKIDGAFAQNLAESADDRFFIRTLIDLARNLGIPIVAEWIEDEATAQILADWGVEYLQGHLFGKAEIPAPKPTAAPARGL